MKQHKKEKLIVILGPTASGKSAWGLAFAKKYNGEIVSADSRQIYKELSIGTAKEKGTWKWHRYRRVYMVEGIAHYLIDFLSPKKRWSVSNFRRKAIWYIQKIHKRNKVPFLVGGTGLYISSVVDNFSIPSVEADSTLRAELEQKDAEEVYALLAQIDPVAAEHIGPFNKRRLIRAFEVTTHTGIPFSSQQQLGEPLFDVLQIGVLRSQEEMDQRIRTRVTQMFREGLLDEVQRLLKQYKHIWQLPSTNTVGYREFEAYTKGLVTLDMVHDEICTHTRQYAKRQMTWFKRDQRIYWCATQEEAEKYIEHFLHTSDPPDVL